MQASTYHLADFTVKSELGHGGSGTVFKVQNKIDGAVYVVKQIQIGQVLSRQEREAMKEVSILRQLNHPHIIKYYSSWVEKGSMCILMEYAEGGDLHRLIRTQREKKRHILEKDVWKYAGQLASAISYLHSKGVIHRDIKSANVLLTKQRQIKLADLGASKITREFALHVTRIGTPLFLAPELVKQTPYDSKIDVWALGCVLYHLTTFKPPFHSDNLLSLGHAIVHKQPKPLPLGYSPRLSTFIFALLEKRPSARPTIYEAVAMIPGIGKLIDIDSTRMESLATEFTMGRSIRDGESNRAQLGRGDSTLEIATKPVSKAEPQLRMSGSPGLSCAESVSPARCSIQSRSPSVPRPPSIFKKRDPKPTVSSLHCIEKPSEVPHTSTAHIDSSFSLYPDSASYPNRPGTSTDLRISDGSAMIAFRKAPGEALFAPLVQGRDSRPGTAAVAGWNGAGRYSKLASFMTRPPRILVFSSMNATPVARKKLSVSDLCEEKGT